MLRRLFGLKRAEARIATALYGAIVTQARHPALYADLNVPDTVSGRFEMVVLHMSFVVDRLQAGNVGEREVGQAVFDLFCIDMDRSLRELGIGDMGVPRKMRQVGEAFYGRAGAYAAALAAGEEGALAAVLARNVFKDGPDAIGKAGPLARYVADCAVRFGETTPTALVTTALPFPDARVFAGRVASGAAA